MTRTMLALGVAFCALMSGASQAADPAAGRQAFETCLGCHGSPNYVNVYPSYHVPYLAGQHEQYLVAALKAYRDGDRSHPTMQANAASLSDDDIANIAAFLAGLKP